MKKFERLATIVDTLEGTDSIITAEDLAIKLKVSTRTIYRYIATLIETGLPVVGEAGTGYTLEHNLRTTPISFDSAEREALLLGTHMIKHWSDKNLSGAAQSAINKIIAAMGTEPCENIEDTTLFYPPSKERQDISIDILSLRRAMKNKNIIQFEHTPPNMHPEYRTIHPIGTAFFGPSWLLVGWCPEQAKFCNFRIENMRQLVITSDHFSDYTSPNLGDFIDVMKNAKTDNIDQPANTDTPPNPEAEESTKKALKPDHGQAADTQGPDARQAG